MRLKFVGSLKNLFGDEIVMASPSVADAIEGFTRQSPAWPQDMVVRVITDDNELLDTVDKLHDYSGDVTVMPSMSGGGGKFGSILIGAALIGAAFIPGVGAAIVAGHLIATGIAASLIISGGLMILQGVVNLFMKAPKLNAASADDPEASKYLAINGNTTQVGTPMTLAWGRIDIGGHWLSLQSDSSNLSYGTFAANP